MSPHKKKNAPILFLQLFLMQNIIPSKNRRERMVEGWKERVRRELGEREVWRRRN